LNFVTRHVISIALNSVSQWLNRIANIESKAPKLRESGLTINDSTALLLGPCRSFSFLILNTVGCTSWRGTSPLQGLYLHTGQLKQNKCTDIHAYSWIQTYDHSIRADETVDGLYPVANVIDVINCLVY
jgi:hypothetical protein